MPSTTPLLYHTESHILPRLQMGKFLVINCMLIIRQEQEGGAGLSRWVGKPVQSTGGCGLDRGQNQGC